jgi:hypothetical protein
LLNDKDDAEVGPQVAGQWRNCLAGGGGLDQRHRFLYHRCLLKSLNYALLPAGVQAVLNYRTISWAREGTAPTQSMWGMSYRTLEIQEQNQAQDRMNKDVYL